GRDEAGGRRGGVLRGGGDGRQRPPRDRGRAARGEDAPPELPAGDLRVHRFVPLLAGVVHPRMRTADRSSSRLTRRTCRSADCSRIFLAGLPPQRAPAGISSPFMRKESAASTAPSPIVTP